MAEFITPLEKLAVPRLRYPGGPKSAAAMQDAQLPCEMRPADLLAGIVPHGEGFVVRVKCGGELDVADLAEQANAAGKAAKDAAEKSVEGVVLASAEFKTVAELGTHLDTARAALESTQAKLAEAEAERQAAIESGKDPRGFRPTIRTLQDDEADLKAVVTALETKYDAAHAALTALRRKHTLFAAAAPLRVCAERREALQTTVNQFLQNAARELFAIVSVENAFTAK